MVWDGSFSFEVSYFVGCDMLEMDGESVCLAMCTMLGSRANEPKFCLILYISIGEGLWRKKLTTKKKFESTWNDTEWLFKMKHTMNQSQICCFSCHNGHNNTWDSFKTAAAVMMVCLSVVFS